MRWMRNKNSRSRLSINGDDCDECWKSIRTVRRSIAKLEELGIIKRVATKERHKRGGYSANLYVFLTSAIDRMDDRMKMSACKTEDNATGCSKMSKKLLGKQFFLKTFHK